MNAKKSAKKSPDKSGDKSPGKSRHGPASVPEHGAQWSDPMGEGELRPCAYHVVRYLPNLVRDEWVNIGILLFDPANGRILRRLMEEPGEFARVRRLHPGADEELLRRLPEEFEAQFAVSAPSLEARASESGGALGNLARLAQTLSNAVQLSAQKGLLAADLDAELDRLYRDHVEAPRYGRVFEDLATRNAIRTRANQVFRSTGIWPRLERRIRVAEFTYTGDPLRVDYAYRRNGTRGFVQALPLGRDPAQAKILAFTADAIRAKLPKTEFLAVTEVAPRPEDNPRHRFVTGLLEERGISVIPLTRLADWAFQLRPTLLGGSSN
jgi:hypothetical protein